MMGFSPLTNDEKGGAELPKLRKGRPRNWIKRAWLECVEALMRAGVERPSHMVKRTGLTFRTAKRWMNQVGREWAKELPDEERRYRIDALYDEASDAASKAWATAISTNNPCVKLGALKAILESNRKRSVLLFPGDD